jgi:hypothetical protein
MPKLNDDDPMLRLAQAKAARPDPADESQDEDDDGSDDVHHYPLPPALLAAADKILGPEETDRLLGITRAGTAAPRVAPSAAARLVKP